MTFTLAADHVHGQAFYSCAVEITWSASKQNRQERDIAVPHCQIHQKHQIYTIQRDIKSKPFATFCRLSVFQPDSNNQSFIQYNKQPCTCLPKLCTLLCITVRYFACVLRKTVKNRRKWSEQNCSKLCGSTVPMTHPRLNGCSAYASVSSFETGAIQTQVSPFSPFAGFSSFSALSAWASTEGASSMGGAVLVSAPLVSPLTSPIFGSLLEDSSLAATEAKEAKEVLPLKGICAGVAAGSWKALTTRI